MVGCYRYPLLSANPIFEGFEQGALKTKHSLGRYHMIDIMKFDFVEKASLQSNQASYLLRTLSYKFH